MQIKKNPRFINNSDPITINGVAYNTGGDKEDVSSPVAAAQTAQDRKVSTATFKRREAKQKQQSSQSNNTKKGNYLRIFKTIF